MYVHQGGQKKALRLPGLEVPPLWAATWAPGIEPWSLARAASALNHCVHSPGTYSFLIHFSFPSSCQDLWSLTSEYILGNLCFFSFFCCYLPGILITCLDVPMSLLTGLLVASFVPLLLIEAAHWWWWPWDAPLNRVFSFPFFFSCFFSFLWIPCSYPFGTDRYSTFPEYFPSFLKHPLLCSIAPCTIILAIFLVSIHMELRVLQRQRHLSHLSILCLSLKIVPWIE